MRPSIPGEGQWYVIRVGFRDRGAPILALRTHEIMRKVYSWGIGRELVEVNPCLGIEPVSKQTSRERTYTPDEILTLFAMPIASAAIGAILSMLVLLIFLVTIALGVLAGA